MMKTNALKDAWIPFRDGSKQFKTTLGRPELAALYSGETHPLMIRIYEEYFLDGESFPRFAARTVRRDCFGKEFFNHLKGSEAKGYSPPMLLEFNCLHCHKNSFQLKPNLGNTQKKFVRFQNPIDSHEYLASNIFSQIELLEYLDSNIPGSKFYSHDPITPIPTFQAFLQVLSFSRRFH
jgi:hypothetical protein